MCGRSAIILRQHQQRCEPLVLPNRLLYFNRSSNTNQRYKLQNYKTFRYKFIALQLLFAFG